ncbi:MAG: cell division protein ZapE [Paraglaciecola sp.]|jgi:cell division protein ZapE
MAMNGEIYAFLVNRKYAFIMSASTPWQKYQHDLKNSNFQPDVAQEKAVKELQRLFEDLTEAEKEPGWWIKLQFVLGLNIAKTTTQGIYFWGGVGRGKTYLVDTFYECLPFERKLRIHFHRFMHRVHEELTGLAGQSDPLKIIAANFARQYRVICFDEFFVSDITDAMILGTLMQELFARDIVLVATSNIVPDELYRNGLQRSRFIPAIELINRHTNIVNVDSGIDYRLRTLEQAEIYHYPLDTQAKQNLELYFQQLSPESSPHKGSIDILGRQIPTLHCADGVVMFEFNALCDGPRSQTDYMEISRCYHSVLIANVQQMGRSADDIARRFIAMVDEFYERNVKLIMSAQVPMVELYTQGSLDFEFRRCLSRLQEMQSHDYLASQHLP